MFWNKKEEETVQEDTVSINEIKRMLNSLPRFRFDLEKVEQEALTTQTYLKKIVKDSADYINAKDEQNLLQAEKRVIAKIKYLTTHAELLKNSLEQLDKEYYEVALVLLKKIEEIKKESRIQDISRALEKNKEKIDEIILLITRIVEYDQLFNPENNLEYKKVMKEELGKNQLPQEVEQLSILLEETFLDKHTRISVDPDPLASLKQKF